MIVSVEWLKDFVDIHVAPDDLADLLTNAGLESEVIFGGRALDIDVTPNRPDCMSHKGVAREIALLTDQNLKSSMIDLKESSEQAADTINVEIVDAEKCPRYACRVVKNVTVGTSPGWMSTRLEIVGIRSINTVVDISNYVLMELGHPLHTFDLAKIGGNKIVVRTAKQGETLVSLDGLQRKLNRNHLLICDAHEAVALAGIMGGENSEVSEETTDVLIESAYFDPVTVRKGSKELGVSTEASKRFERGTDYEGLVMALDRTAALLAEIAGGEILTGVVDEYPKRLHPVKIHFQTARASAIAGVRFTDEFIERTFTGLEVSFSKSSEGYECTAPTFRPDLERPIDLTEELARTYGYDKIDSDEAFSGELGEDSGDPLSDIIDLKRFFAGLGFHETVTNSLLNPEKIKDFAPDEAVRLQNPLSLEMSVMRTSLFPGLLNSVAYNLNRGENDLGLFEYGITFQVNKDAKTGCAEKEEFSGILCGDKGPRQWKRESLTRDFYTMKGTMEALTKYLRLSRVRFVPLQNGSVFSVGQALLSDDDEKVGEFGNFSNLVLISYDIDIPVLGFRLNVDTVRRALATSKIHSRVSPYPGISRDLAFVIKTSVSTGEVEKIMGQRGGELLKSIFLYDLYEGDQVEKGYKSVTFNLFFQGDERTLTDKEVDEIVSSIISETSRLFDAKLR